MVRCIEFVRRHGLPLSVRGGGHNVAGHAVHDDAIMLDLSGMKGIESIQRRGRSGPSPAHAFDRATQAFGLATTLGVVSMTGIAGLTLGGAGLAQWPLWTRLRQPDIRRRSDRRRAAAAGAAERGLVLGHPRRRRQLRGHNLIRVPTPSGRSRTGGLSYPLSLAPHVLRFYGDFVKAAPDELSTAVALAVNPAGEPAVTIAVCYCGPIDDGERLLRPLRTFQSPVEDGIQPPHSRALAMTDSPPVDCTTGSRAGCAISATAPLRSSCNSSRICPPLRAALASNRCTEWRAVLPSATAFPHRAEQYDFLILSQWSDTTDSDRNVEWTKALLQAMQPHLEGSVYVNNLGDEGPARVQAAYGDNFSRLAALKGIYDPDNLFRANQNIDPASRVET